MAKITDYAKITDLTNDNVFLVDGVNGTKGILAHDLANALPKIMTNDDYYSEIDRNLNYINRRGVWRGKNLGSTVTTEQYNEIKDGSFNNLFLGDFWEISNFRFRIVDFDYWWNKGDEACYDHHLVIMPDGSMNNHKMNETNTTESGYAGSRMRLYLLNELRPVITECFGGIEHLLSHREYLTNAVTNGYPSGRAWYDSTIELPNEIMIYGSNIFTPAGDGSVVPSKYTINTSQLAGMMIAPNLTNINLQTYWLRDVVSTSSFADVNANGLSNYDYANYSHGVRPVFGLVG